MTSHSQPHQALIALAAALMACQPLGSQALEFSSDEFKGNLDTTLSYGVARRVQGRMPSLVGIANGGSSRSANEDDGNLNYDKNALISSVARVQSELQLNWRDFASSAAPTRSTTS